MRYQGARDSRSGTNEPLALLHQYGYSPYCSPYISLDKEKLFNNQELYSLGIISSILETFMFDSGVTM